MSAAQQLKLLSEPTVRNIYRAGDWVKTKRKPEIAAHIKRGECFRVNAVHPENGSVKIWNPHINQWDFLYPDEIKLTKSLTPITIVETVVEQIATPQLTVESVVEQIATQLTVESVVEQIHNCHNGWVESHYKIRRNGKQHSINCPEIGCTGPYYMYRWREGKKQRAKYLPVSKCPKILQAIARARPIEEILKIISDQ
jgi:hypothetical protein